MESRSLHTAPSLTVDAVQAEAGLVGAPLVVVGQRPVEVAGDRQALVEGGHHGLEVGPQRRARSHPSPRGHARPRRTRLHSPFSDTTRSRPGTAFSRQ